jgi:hypothetical protein
MTSSNTKRKRTFKKSSKRRKIITVGIDTKDENTEQYAKSLINPMTTISPFIPDLNSYPSSSFMMQQEFTISLPVGTDAIPKGFGIRLGPQPEYTILTAGSGGAGLVYLTGTAIPFQGCAQLKAIYDNVRLVSSGVQIEFTGNDSNNNGEIIVANYSQKELSGGSPSVNLRTYYVGAVGTNVGLTLPVLQNSRDVFVGPLKFGAYARFLPADPQDTTYASTQYPYTVESADFITAPINVSGWQNLVVMVTGNASLGNTTNFKIKVVSHFEGLALTSTNPYNATPSPMDVHGYQAAWEAQYACPTVGGFSAGPDTWNINERKVVNRYNEVMLNRG